MILHTFDIPIDHFGDNEPILLMPVGDIQWFGEYDATAIKMLARHIQWGVDHGAYFLGMGDYIDTFSPSNRERLAAAGVYDTGKRWMDASAKKLVEELYEVALAPSKGRWLGLLRGHHYFPFSYGSTSDHLLADLLETKFLGDSAIVRLRFTVQMNKKSAKTKDPIGTLGIWCHHGVGHGKRLSAPLNTMDHLPTYWPTCSIFLIGHQHKKVGAPIDQTFPVWPREGADEMPKLIYRTCIMACTGSFLKGYVEGRETGNYVEKGMLPPVALGGVLIRIRPRWVQKFGSRIWLPDLSVEQ